MKALTLDNIDTFETTITSSDQPVLVDFWAPWCGPCQMLAPLIDQLAGEQEGKAIVGKVDIDEAPALARRYGIQAIPTLIVFKNGEPVQFLRGVQSKAALEKAIQAA